MCKIKQDHTLQDPYPAQHFKIRLVERIPPNTAARFFTNLECRANVILDDIYKILKVKKI